MPRIMPVERRWSPSIASSVLFCSIVAPSVVIPFLDGHSPLRIPSAALYAYGGATAASVSAGEWWRLITSQFLHVYLWHALLNAVAILVAGSALERMLGATRYLIVYFVGGTVGQIAAVSILPDIVATGASQAAIAICAALLVTPGRRRKAAVAAAAYILMAAMLDVLSSQSIKPAHAASVAAGLLLGALWRRDVSSRRAAVRDESL